MCSFLFVGVFLGLLLSPCNASESSSCTCKCPSERRSPSTSEKSTWSEEDTSDEEEERKRQRQVVRVVATVDPPFANPCFPTYPHDNCTKPGVEIEFLHTVLNGMLQYEIEWIVVPGYDLMSKYVVNNSADIIGISDSLDQEFLDAGLQASPIMLRDSLMLVVAELRVDDDYSGAFKVFNWKLWVSIFGTYQTLSYLVDLSVDIENKRINSGRLLRLIDLPWIRDKMLQTLWLVQLAVILKISTSVMSIHLSTPIPRSRTHFKSYQRFQELLKRGKCSWVLPNAYKNDSDFFPSLINPDKNVKAQWAQGFRDAYRYNPNSVIYVKDRDAVVEKILGRKECLVGLDYVSVRPRYENNYCSLVFHTSLYLTENHQKKSPLHEFQYVYYYAKEASDFLGERLRVVMQSWPLFGYYHFLTRDLESSRHITMRVMTKEE